MLARHAPETGREGAAWTPDPGLQAPSGQWRKSAGLGSLMFSFILKTQAEQKGSSSELDRKRQLFLTEPGSG